MQILHSCYQSPDLIVNYTALPNYINYAIKRLGHELITFDDRRFILPGAVRSAMPFLQTLELRHRNNALVKLVKGTMPEICLFTGGHRTLPKTMEAVQKLGITTILWTTDAPRDFQPIIDLARMVDHVVCAGTEAIELLGAAGVKDAHWLPFACDPSFFTDNVRNEEEVYDVVFVGSWYPNRAKLLESLTDYNLAVWGPGWNYLEAGSPLKPFIMGGALSPDEWINVYRKAKIVLVSHFHDETIPCYQASPKVYEALACKTFVLCDAQPDVKSLFKSDEHLVLFDGGDALKEKIGEYLPNKDARKRIALSGYNEVIEKHTYDCRLETLLRLIS